LKAPARQLRALHERRPRWPKRVRARGHNVVVLYHRIAPEVPNQAGMVVDPDRFRRQLQALRRHFDVLPAADILRPSRRPTAAITFDDGYADNLDVAAPVLRELGLPASLFIVTSALDEDREFWWDRLEHILLQRLEAEEITVRVGPRLQQLRLDDGNSRREALALLSRLLVRESPDGVERTLDQLEALAGSAPAACARHRRLTRQQIVGLAADPLLEIGSHTCSHSALRRLPRAQCQKELVASRHALRDVLGAAPRLLAYPYGAPGTVGRGDARRARAAGYDLAFVNVTGPTEHASPFAVPRIAVGEWEPDEFLTKITRWSSR
jgi:peptidoglycan/xylan/chitin deacetylase (PgdA/CDA1 family)